MAVPDTQRSDWTTDAADAIDRAVATVRDRTVVPAQTITRGVVFGLLAALFVLPALLMLFVGVFRGLVLAYQGEVWAAWLTLGGICVLAGMLLWSRRTA
jgi:hypothetical protein